MIRSVRTYDMTSRDWVNYHTQSRAASDIWPIQENCPRICSTHKLSDAQEPNCRHLKTINNFSLPAHSLVFYLLRPPSCSRTESLWSCLPSSVLCLCLLQQPLPRALATKSFAMQSLSSTSAMISMCSMHAGKLAQVSLTANWLWQYQEASARHLPGSQDHSSNVTQPAESRLPSSTERIWFARIRRDVWKCRREIRRVHPFHMCMINDHDWIFHP